MALNIELLRRLRTRFLRMRHQEHFNMDPIAAKTDCGAVMCIAGHTLVLAGYKMRLSSNAPATNTMWPGRQDFEFYTPLGRKVRNVLSAAGKELGIPYKARGGNRAFDLFHDWDLKTPKEAAARIQKLIDTAP